jgi:release factor glutamine methyltransferase
MAYNFRHLALETSEEVYAPAEDSELLAGCIEADGLRVLDVGTGTGIQALTAAASADSVVGVDINPRAVELARRNAEANGVANASFAVSDLFSRVRGMFDLIVFNPPYLPGTPEGELQKAWAGGHLGVEVINRFVDAAGAHLRPGGKVLLLVSSVNRPAEVMRRMQENGLQPEVVASRRIFFEDLRVVSAVYKPKR